MDRKAIVLFSGGSDCTLVAALAAEQHDFDEIVLLTYKVPVSCLDENASRNVPLLRKRYPDVRFTHEMIPVGSVLDKVTTKGKFRSVLKHGLIESSLCLHCRLAMHVRTVMYCLDNNIQDVFDGSNVTMALWVDQTRQGLELVDQLYSAFGITIKHPVFNYAGDDLFDLVKYLSEDDLKDVVNKSTSHELYEKGVLQEKDHKSDYLTSYRAQPVCLGVVLSLLHSLGYSIPLRGYDRYQQLALNWLDEKTSLYEELLTEYSDRRERSELGALV